MAMKTIQVFSDKERQLAELLIAAGLRKTVAIVLVFLSETREATSHDIERGADLRQPEVSIALRHLLDRGWVAMHGYQSENKGRPVNVYRLALPLEEIIEMIGSEKKAEVNRRIALLGKMKTFVS